LGKYCKGEGQHTLRGDKNILNIIKYIFCRAATIKHIPWRQKYFKERGVNVRLEEEKHNKINISSKNVRGGRLLLRGVAGLVLWFPASFVLVAYWLAAPLRL